MLLCKSNYYLEQKAIQILNIILISYNIIKEVASTDTGSQMSTFNPLRTIGQAFFFLKFYFFIGFAYIWNFVTHHIEKIIYGNSKTVICPYKKTHPDVFLTIEELIKLDGYTIQEYEFQTTDSAYVTMWRVRKQNFNPLDKKYPILLMHGLLDCSISWFFHEDKKNCLPYLLAEQGFDVWVGNNRGTKHSSKNSHQKDYWEFNLDHFVDYDQPRLIQGVLEETNSEKIIYIGHSQGSTQFLISTGVHSDLSEKIACFIGMGTVISLENLDDHKVLKYLGKLRAVQFLKMLGFKTVLSLPKWVTSATGILIYNTKFYFSLFFGIVNILCGTPSKNKINPERLGIIISHEPGGASIPNVLQWIQFHKSGKMARYDHGKKKNMQKYGSEVPPEYTFHHMKEFDFNSYIFKGEKDAVISEKDYLKIVDQMNTEKFNTIQIKDYAHLDYVWGVQAHKDVYHPILNILQKQGF